MSAPTDGSAPAPGPGPVPPARRAFRRAAPVRDNTLIMPVSFTKELGIPPIIGSTEGYNFTENADKAPSTYVPSTIAMKLAIHLTHMKLAATDRFLKETNFWHPIIDEAYIAFAFYYHILRCRRLLGDISPDELNLLADLERLYPPTSIAIPGSVVHVFNSVSVTESPIPWQGLIGPRLPHYAGATGARALRTAGSTYTYSYQPQALLDQVHQMLRATTTAAAAPQTITARYNWNTRVFSNATDIDTANADRWYLNSPQWRMPVIDGQFVYDRIIPVIARDFGLAAAPNGFTVNRAALDIPAKYEVNAAHNTAMTPAEFLGVVDYSLAANATPTYRNWINQYSSTMNIVCKYVKGSRALSDIEVSGLGASTPVWTYLDNQITLGDPATFAGQAAGPIIANTYRGYHINSLSATAESRDPELLKLAEQYSSLAQVNVVIPTPPAFANGDATRHLRSGPFWAMPICDFGHVIDAARYARTAIPTTVTSSAI